MIKSTSVTLGEHFGDFVDTQIASGRFGSATDVVAAGLRLLERQEAKLTALRAALDVGERSGTPIPFDIDEFLLQLNAEDEGASQ